MKFFHNLIRPNSHLTFALIFAVAHGLLGVEPTVAGVDQIFADGFESGDTSNWSSTVPLAPSTVSISVAAAAARTGNFGLKVDADGFADSLVALELDGLALEADVEVTIRFWVSTAANADLPLGKAPTPSDPQRTQIFVRHGASSLVPLLADSVLSLTAGQFEEVMVTFTPSAAEVATGPAKLRFRFDGNGDAGQVFYFDDFLVCKGPPSSFQPDIRIGKKRSPASQLRDDFYTPIGAGGQKVTVKLEGRRTGKIHCSVQNDGNLDTLFLKSSGSVRGLVVKTFRLTGGRRNVTGSMRHGTGFAMSNLANGELIVFQTKVKNKSGGRLRRNLKFTAISQGDTFKRDVAKLKVNGK